MSLASLLDLAVADAVASLRADAVVAVAYSGGRDSTALLECVVRLAAPPRKVVALHVHHGLRAHADAWVSHCERACAEWRRSGHDVSFRVARLEGRPAGGESIEAWARAGRYQALGEMAREAGARAVLLAHHQRDQAETFLLQALRGGGVRGLASMPAAVDRDGVLWLRPWLDQSREAVEAHVREHGLAFIDDDSNVDARFARNRLRLSAWPLLVAAFPQAEQALARAAAWAAEAADALDELARIDLASVRLQEEPHGPGPRIDLAVFEQLSKARRSNLLRAWLIHMEDRPPSTHLVQRLLDELPSSGFGTWQTMAGHLRRYRGELAYEPRTARPPLRAAVATHISITEPGLYALAGWQGDLLVEVVDNGGVALCCLGDLTMKARSGGESFQLAANRPARALKKQFQQAAVPAWDRRGPLLYAGKNLVFVPGLGIDARMLASPGEVQVSLSFCPAAKMSGSAGRTLPHQD